MSYVILHYLDENIKKNTNINLLTEYADLLLSLNINRKIIQMGDELFQIFRGYIGKIHINTLFAQGFIHFGLCMFGNKGCQFEPGAHQFKGDPNIHTLPVSIFLTRFHQYPQIFWLRFPLGYGSG